MKILLVNPPNCGRSIPEEQYGIDTIKMVFRGEPLALETLAGCLDSRHTVAIADLKAEPQALNQALEGDRPDLVGITGVTCEANTMLALARQARAAGVRHIVAGGHHASNDPEFFNRPEIDFVAVGMGSVSFSELVENLDRGAAQAVPGMAACTPGAPLKFEPRAFGRADLAEDRPPRYDLTARTRSHYFLGRPEARLGFVVSAMGCTHRCAFCAIPNLTGGRYLVRSAEAVARDISLLDAPIIRLVDANTFGDPAQAAELCARLNAAGVKRRYMADVRADTVVNHPELMRSWRDAGLQSVIIGFEEMDDGRLVGLNKRSSSNVNLEALRILKGLGLMVVGDFIVNPDYTNADFDALESLIKEQQISLPVPSILTPMPGTPLHQALRGSIINHDLDYYTFSNAVLPTRLPEREFYGRYTGLLRACFAQFKAAAPAKA